MVFDNNQFSCELPVFGKKIGFYSAKFNKLSGSIPVLPTALQSLYLNDNYLNDHNLTLTNGLAYLSIGNNMMGGSIPFFPLTLIRFLAQNNDFSGVLPKLPFGMEFINLSNNIHLQGTVNISKPMLVDISNTSISNFLMASSLSLAQCNLDNTPLLGKVSSSLYSKCSRNNLIADSGTYSALLTSTSLLAYSSCRYDVPIVSDLSVNSSIGTQSHYLTLTSVDLITSTDFIDTGYRSNEFYTFESSATESTEKELLSEMTITSTTLTTYNTILTYSSTNSVAQNPITRKVVDKVATTIYLSPLKSSTVVTTKKTKSSAQTIVYSTISVIYAQLNPSNTLDLTKITLSAYLLIKIFLNWGLIIYIMTEFKKMGRKPKNRTTFAMSEL